MPAHVLVCIGPPVYPLVARITKGICLLAALFSVLQELQALREYLEVLSEKYESLQSASGHNVNEKTERHLF